MVFNSEIAMQLTNDVVNTFCRVIVEVEEVGFWLNHGNLGRA